MFPKRKRITKKHFGEIMKTGNTLFGSFFIFKYIINSNLPRYTFVASKNVATKAVVRNKLKRRGFNILKEFPIEKNQGIFFYKKNGSNASYQEIKNDIILLIKKSKVV